MKTRTPRVPKIHQNFNQLGEHIVTEHIVTGASSYLSDSLSERSGETLILVLELLIFWNIALKKTDEFF